MPRPLNLQRAKKQPQRINPSGTNRSTKKRKTIIDVSLLVIPLELMTVLLTAGKDGTPTTHTVAAGETVSQICENYDIDHGDMIKANPDLNPRRLRVGQSVVILPTPLIIRLGRKMDRLAKKVGFDNPKFTSAAYQLKRNESD